MAIRCDTGYGYSYYTADLFIAPLGRVMESSVLTSLFRDNHYRIIRNSFARRDIIPQLVHYPNGFNNWVKRGR